LTPDGNSCHNLREPTVQFTLKCLAVLITIEKTLRPVLWQANAHINTKHSRKGKATGKWVKCGCRCCSSGCRVLHLPIPQLVLALQFI